MCYGGPRPLLRVGCYPKLRPASAPHTGEVRLARAPLVGGGIAEYRPIVFGKDVDKGADRLLSRQLSGGETESRISRRCSLARRTA